MQIRPPHFLTLPHLSRLNGEITAVTQKRSAESGEQLPSINASINTHTEANIRHLKEQLQSLESKREHIVSSAKNRMLSGEYLRHESAERLAMTELQEIYYGSDAR